MRPPRDPLIIYRLAADRADDIGQPAPDIEDGQPDRPVKHLGAVLMTKAALETDRLEGTEGAGQATQGAAHQGVLRDRVDRQAARQGGGVVRQSGSQVGEVKKARARGSRWGRT